MTVKRDWVLGLPQRVTAKCAMLSVLVLAGIFPAILPIIRRAGPVLLAITGSVALFVLLINNEKKFIQPKSASWESFSVTFLAFLFLALSSTFWSPVPGRALMAIVSVAFLFIAMRLVVESGRRQPLPFPIYLPWCLALGAAVIIADSALGGVVLRLVHSKPEAYRYNMVVVSLIALSSVVLHQKFPLLPRLICLISLSGAV